MLFSVVLTGIVLHCKRYEICHSFLPLAECLTVMFSGIVFQYLFEDGLVLLITIS